MVETVADRLALAEPEQVLRSEVEIRDDEMLVESDDCDTKAAEDLVGARRARGAAFVRRR